FRRPAEGHHRAGGSAGRNPSQVSAGRHQRSAGIFGTIERSAAMTTASQPFQFSTAAYLTQVENQKATCALELLEGLDHASDAAIFYHTFQSLGRYHFLQGFSNDFARSEEHTS